MKVPSKLWVSPAGRRWMLDRLAIIDSEFTTLNERRRATGDPARSELGLGFKEGEPSVGLDADAQKLIREQKELTEILAVSSIPPVQKGVDSVHIGTMVRLIGMTGRRKFVRQLYIGGHYDGLIKWSNLPKTVTAVVSYDCEVGKTLLGKTVGDEITIRGRGELAGTWEIDEIKVAQFLQSVATTVAA